MPTPSEVWFSTYTGERLPIKGQIDMEVCYKDQTKNLTVIVVEGNGPSLMGRNRLSLITLDLTKLCVNHFVLDQHSEVFQSGMGT